MSIEFESLEKTFNRIGDDANDTLRPQGDLSLGKYIFDAENKWWSKPLDDLSFGNSFKGFNFETSGCDVDSYE